MPTPLPLWPGITPDAECAPSIIPFLLPGKPVRPLVVVCPGGGYHRRAPHAGDPIARMLNGHGLHAAVLHYRTAPHRHPIPHGDAVRGLRLVRHHAVDWKVDPTRVGILGFSAGGHLAASLCCTHDAGDPAATDPIARQSSRPDAGILCSPVISFGPCGHRGSCLNLLGDPPPVDVVEQLSLENRVTASTPPCFLWHTAEDAAVPVENSLRFVQALAKVQVPTELHVFPQGRHGLGLAAGTDAAGWPDLLGRWLRQMGWTG